MYVNLTIIKVSPENVKKATEILWSDRLKAFFHKLGGVVHAYLTESVEEPGKLYSISMWKTMADAQRVMTDPNYGAYVGELRTMLLAAPERYGFNLLMEIKPEDLEQFA